jgi:hypothetical protein
LDEIRIKAVIFLADPTARRIMLKNCAYALLLLGMAATLPLSAVAAPAAPQNAPGISHIVPVQGYGERCHWLRERIRELEARLYYSPPGERPRLERRLAEYRGEFRGACRRWY